MTGRRNARRASRGESSRAQGSSSAAVPAWQMKIFARLGVSPRPVRHCRVRRQMTAANGAAAYAGDVEMLQARAVEAEVDASRRSRAALRTGRRGARGALGRRCPLGLRGLLEEGHADGAQPAFTGMRNFMREQDCRRHAAGSFDADHVFGVEREVILDGEAAARNRTAERR